MDVACAKRYLRRPPASFNRAAFPSMVQFPESAHWLSPQPRRRSVGLTVPPPGEAKRSARSWPRYVSGRCWQPTSTECGRTVNWRSTLQGGPLLTKGTRDIARLEVALNLALSYVRSRTAR
jgi:hypothetical protein